MSYIGGPGNTFLRREFRLGQPVEKAELRITADPHSYAWPQWMEQPDCVHNWLLAGSFLKYRLFLNETPVGAGPMRPVVSGNVSESVFDVSALLRLGANVLGVISRAERYGVSIVLDLRLADGSRRKLVSDHDWKLLPANDIYSPVCWEKPGISFPKGSSGPGEYPENIDGTKFPHGWLVPGFADSGWESARELAPGDIYPIEPPEAPSGEFFRTSAQEVVRLADGRVRVDFGTHMIGSIELRCPAAALVELRLGEELLPSGGVRFQMRTGNCYQEGWRFPEGGATLAHFGLRSFRYAELVGWPGAFTGEEIAAIAFHAPFSEDDSEFRCSDPRLEQVWRLCRNSIRQTTLDVYYDCPSRERMAYEADDYINMLTHFAMESRTAVARRTIRYQMNHLTWPCEWRMFLIPLVREYWMHTGDLELVEELYDRLDRECSFHRSIRNGLVREFPMPVIVDWPPSCRDGYEFGPESAVPNAFLYLDLVSLAELAAALGRDADARERAAQAEEVRHAFNTRLYDPEQQLFIDHPKSKHAGFHANVFAVAFGLADPEKAESAADFLDRAGMRCSVYGAQFYLEALFRQRRETRAVELMVSNSDRSWLGMIERGATCTTEAWNPELKPNMSFVHPWGSAPGNLIVRHLFGLQPTEPGWKQFRFDPRPGPLRSGFYRLRVPGGVLEAEFHRDEKGEVISSARML